MAKGHQFHRPVFGHKRQGHYSQRPERAKERATAPEGEDAWYFRITKSSTYEEHDYETNEWR